jgi:hypothetical protein
MLQDAGSTFGPGKANLRRWNAVRIWADEASCLVSLKSLPYQGGTFQETHVSEGGRRFLAARLKRLSRTQIADLFRGSQMAHRQGWWSRARDLNAWVAAFEDKVRQIADRPPCPPVS